LRDLGKKCSLICVAFTSFVLKFYFISLILGQSKCLCTKLLNGRETGTAISDCIYVLFVFICVFPFILLRGIWTRDIKIATNIPQHTLAKTLKILEQRSLIKSVRSVVSKSKKLYVLFDVVPAKSITGGPWYSDQEFDHEFVSELSNYIVQMVRAENLMDLPTIAERIKISGISKV
jgi:hypothetical protein